MKSSFASHVGLGKSLASAVVAVAAFVLGAPGCSSDSESPATPGACDDSQCYPGNKCLPLNGTVECRKTCSSNTDATASCPYGYTCVAGTEAEPFCIKDNTQITKAAGQWGTTCTALGGIAANPSCDSTNGFSCFGVSTTDGDAYCTKFDCETDRDCGAGFFCGDANTTPNVETDLRTVGETHRVCQRRAYCAPCSADLDCPSLDGLTQHCIADDNGAGFCTPECSTAKGDKTCGRDAKCVDINGDGTNVCYPYAGSCAGDGSVCEPCRSDKDCGEDGACVKGQFTTEKSCAKKSAITCAWPEGGPVAGKDYDCPKADRLASTPVVCLGSLKEPTYKTTPFSGIPKNYCHGLYFFGTKGQESQDVGCWSR